MNGRELSSTEEALDYIKNTPVSIIRVLGENPFIHTHGLEKFGHKNIEIIVDVEESYVGEIIMHVVGCIMTGTKLKNHTVYKMGRYGNILIREIEREDDGLMLRLLLPDETGRLPTDEFCSLKYKNQLF